MLRDKKHLIVGSIAALLMAGSIGLNVNSLGVFLTPVAMDLEVGVGQMSMHSTILSLGIAVASFLIPPVIKRVNIRLMITVATIVVATATLGMSMATQVWHFNVLALVRGMASAFYGIVTLQLLINNWFQKRHGLVTSIVFSFSGLAGAIFTPVLSYVIQSYGWQTAYLVQAVLFILLSCPAVIYPLKFRPEEAGLLPYGYGDGDGDDSQEGEGQVQGQGGDNESRFAVTPFILFVIVSVLASGLTGFIQHLSAVGESSGLSVSVGALMISASMVGNIVFKLLIGIISDHQGVMRAVYSIMTVIVSGLILIYLGDGMSLLIIGSFLFGSCYAMSSVGISLVTHYLFGKAGFVRIFPVINFMANIGAALAVSAYGYSYDLKQNYNSAMIISMVACAIIVLFISLANQMMKSVKS